MIQICVMAGHSARMRPEKKFYLTLMGGQELIRPTIARQILELRKMQREENAKAKRQYFLTLMGAVEIKVPTLAEEFIDLRELIRSGSLRREDWELATSELGRSDVTTASFTFMGAFEENTLPSEDEEVDGLALQRHIGNLSEQVTDVLRMGIGKRDAERRATVRRAVDVSTS